MHTAADREPAIRSLTVACGLGKVRSAQAGGLADGGAGNGNEGGEGSRDENLLSPTSLLPRLLLTLRVRGLRRWR